MVAILVKTPASAFKMKIKFWRRL